MALTENVCDPVADSVFPELQAVHAPPSSLHWKVPALLEWNVNVGSWSVGPDGPESIVVVGAALSNANDRDAAADVLPNWSVALTEKVCAPPPTVYPLG